MNEELPDIASLDPAQLSGCCGYRKGGCCGSQDSLAPPPEPARGCAPQVCVSARRDGFEYYGDFLKHCDFPMGGFAAGQVILKGDGTLQDWTVVNRVRKENQPMDVMPANFFGVQVDNEQPFLLANPKCLESSTENTRATQGLSVKSICAKYPVADVNFACEDNQLPVAVSLRALTPFTPQDVKNSSLPAAVFQVTVTNPVDAASSRDVRVLLSQQNFVGWDGVASCKDGKNGKAFWGGNQILPFVNKGEKCLHAGLEMVCARLLEDDPFFGTVAVAALELDSLSNVSVITKSQNERELWNSFASGEDVPVGEAEPCPSSPKAYSVCGGLIQSSKLKPGGSTTFTFVLTWHFPNRTREFSVGNRYANILPPRLGNRYSTWFRNAVDVATYVNQNLTHLVASTLAFSDLLYASSVPADIVNSAATAIAIFQSPTMFYTEDGTVLGTEGNGCCPANCTHVYGYTTLIEKLFPSLALNMRRTEFLRNYNKGVSMRFGIGGWAIDGAFACIIKSYLLVQQYPNSEIGWLKELYPNIKDQMLRILDRFDSDGHGVITGAQQNTYDYAMYGANTFIGSYFVAALRATAALADLVGDADWAVLLRSHAQVSSKNYEKVCWREEFQYYVGVVTPDKCKNSYNLACFVDQLCAIGLSTATGLGYNFDAGHEAAARKSILKHNRVTKPPWNDLQKHLFDGDSALTVATYPHGKVSRMRYDTLCSTGFTSPVVAGMLFDRNTTDALTIVSFIRQRQDGRNRSPWNEPECDIYYSRAMAHWNMYEQACGFQFNGPKGVLSVDPRFAVSNFDCFITLGHGWGGYSQRLQGSDLNCSIKLHAGFCELRELVLPIIQAVETDIVFALTVKGEAVSFVRERSRLVLSQTVKISPGRELVVSTRRRVRPTKVAQVSRAGHSYDMLKRSVALLLVAVFLLRVCNLAITQKVVPWNRW